MRDEVPNHRDRVVGALADRQHGVVARVQLLAAGLSAAAIGRAIEAGRLRAVFRGVYAVGHIALRREGWWMATLLVCGEGAALSHRTAASLWGMLTGPLLPIDVSTSTDRGRRHFGITNHRTHVHRIDSLVIDDLRVTTPSRTIVDLAAILEGRALRAAVERAQDLRRFDPEDIRATLERAPRRPGTRRLTNLIVLMQPDKDNAHSHLERQFMALVRKARLPRPQPNREIAGRSRDFAWPQQRLVVETDGYRHHASRAAKRRDNRRDRELTALGWRAVRFTYEEIAFEPAEVAAEVTALLGLPRAPVMARGASRAGSAGFAAETAVLAGDW
jgi:very-short-patch-repair endonuclease